MSLKKNLIFFLPNFSFGGAANSIIRLCEGLDKKKYDIFIISIGKNYYKKRINKFCTKVYELNFTKTIYSFFFIRKIVLELIKKNKNTLFISNINYANVLSVFFLRSILYLKIILIERTSINELSIYFNYKEFIKKNIIKIMIKYFYKKADVIITNSKKTAKDLKQLTKTNKIFYIYPPSIKKVFLYKKPSYNNTKTLRILTVGRLAVEKNLKTVITSLKYLNFKNFKLLIVGAGDEKEKLKKIITNYKLQKKVTFFHQTENLRNYYKSAHLFINSSYFEGFPNSVIEAINYNLPVLCSRSGGGIHDIFYNNKFGNFFNANDYYGLSRLIKKFTENPTKFYFNLEKVKKRIAIFRTKNNINLYNKLFNSLFK